MHANTSVSYRSMFIFIAIKLRTALNLYRQCKGYVANCCCEGSLFISSLVGYIFSYLLYSKKQVGFVCSPKVVCLFAVEYY